MLRPGHRHIYIYSAARPQVYIYIYIYIYLYITLYIHCLALLDFWVSGIVLNMLISPFKIACSVDFLVDRVGYSFVRSEVRVFTLFYGSLKSTRNPIRASLSHEMLFICLYTLLGERENVEFHRQKLFFLLQKSTRNPIRASLSHEMLFKVRGGSI